MIVHLLGVRHHGPGSARSVLRALAELQPDVLLVEVPADAEPSLRWIGDPGLVAPVALLGYVPAEPGRALFAPFASFSPEWQAIAWANEREIPVRAIDLPMAITFANQQDDADPQDLVADPAPVDPLRDLAAAAGDPDPERWWEDVIEHRGDGAHAFDAVAEAMSAAREGTIPSVEEVRREAHMRRAIRRSIKEGHETIVVVCGAWHVPALDLDERLAKTDDATLRGLAKVKVASAWVPWTHRRLTTSSGYGAGVNSPGWYRHVFEHPGSDGVARFFVDAAHLLRAHGLSASPDHLIAGTRLADTLATMRHRPRPGLTEVLDAADAVMGGLDIVRSELVVGDALGEVPDGAPQVPLARDLTRLQKSARLKPDAMAKTVEVDLRTPTGLRKSHLLHRLLALGVPWGVPEEGRGSSGTFRETWRLSWEPELSVRLVERSGYGSTVESAATARLIERGEAARGLVEIVGVLELALQGDLADAITPSVRRLADRAATDPDVGRLMDIVVPLAGALRYGDVRGTDASSLRTVFDGIVVRIIAGLVPACASLDDESAAHMVERMTGVQTAFAMLDHDARRSTFPDVLAQLADRHAMRHGLVSGRATRLLHDGGRWSAVQVERRLSQALSPGTEPAFGAAFVEGFLAGSGTVLVHDAELLAVIDRWLSSLRIDSFDSVVALLRRTFGAFESAERRQMMSLLVGNAIGRSSGFGADVDPRRAAAVLDTVRHLLGVPLTGGIDDSEIDDSSVTATVIDVPDHVDVPAHDGRDDDDTHRAQASGSHATGSQVSGSLRSGAQPSESQVSGPQVSESERRRRWRLVLGAVADTVDPSSADGAPDATGTPTDNDRHENESDEGPGSGGDRHDVDCASPDDASADTSAGRSGLSDDDARIDAALGALYDRESSDAGRRRSGARAGGLGRSKPGVVRWLGDIRRYFPKPVVQVLQRDAVERLDLRQLMLEPELLQAVEPDIGLVTMLVELNKVLPDETRATARQVIAGVLAEIEQRLSDQTRQAVRGALARASRTRRPRPGDIDWPHTIEANLRHWIPEHRTIVPEHLIGYGRRRHSLAKDVIIAVDQSGSMADSVVYASLFAGVLAQLPTLRTRFLAFDTSITDLTPFLHDPVEVLFGVQLGGGTDIASALTYCARQIERPRNSVLFLVSDLFEGGTGELMRRRVGELVDAGVTVIVLLALSDEGTPAHDHDHAAALANLGATVMSTTPDAFPGILADALAH